MASLERRRVLTVLAGTLAAACHPAGAGRPGASAPSAPSIGEPPKKIEKIARSVEILDWTFPTEFGSEKRCAVLLPHPLAPGERLPLLVALHGLGEATDPLSGAMGWPKRYDLAKIVPALHDPPLSGDLFGGFVTPERLVEVNAGLAARAYGGVIVACPYMPSNIGSSAIPFELYAQWMGERLLPRIRSELPVIGTAKATGIDGVSLGGWCALRVGLYRPDLFGAIGTLQPSIADSSMVDFASALVVQHLKGRPLRIVTSTEDYFRAANVLLDQRLTAKGVAHEFLLTEGPHDYPWNRGVGGVEMLLWHDRVLRA